MPGPDVLWTQVDELRATPPMENGYFGDYLRASANDLYVNSSRRGQLYRWNEGRWVFSRRSEELLPFELDWMYEAALADDVLAFVAQPQGGVETLYIFERVAVQGAEVRQDDWTLAFSQAVSTQGTLRAAGRDVVFVSAMGVSFFERAEGGTKAWTLRQHLASPADVVGFGDRPTYFDAPGVALQGDWLFVGAPRADVRFDAAGQATVGVCDPMDTSAGEGRCVREAGAAFAYSRAPGGAWTQTQVLVAPRATSGLGFGHAAALDAPFAAFGVPHESGGCDLATNCVEQSGAVHLFHLAGSEWSADGALKRLAPVAHDYFGDSLIWRANLLLVAAPGHDRVSGSAPAVDTGGIYAFQRPASGYAASGYRETGPFDLGPAQAARYPFPANIQIGGGGLLVASNTAPFIGSDGIELPFAGLVFFLR